MNASERATGYSAPVDSIQAVAACQSTDRFAFLLNRVYWDEMKSVEALSMAIRYFSRFPPAAVSFARCSADEARHVAVVASRLVDLIGIVAPVPDRSAALDRMPGFKSGQQGELSNLPGFIARVYADKQRALRAYEVLGQSLEADLTSQKIFQRLAQDERAHIASLDLLIDWLAEQGYAETISAALAEEVASANPCRETSG